MANNTAPAVRPPSLFWKTLQFPLIRIVLGIVFVGIGVAAAQFIISLLKQVFALSSPLPIAFDLLEILLVVLATSLAYGAYVHLIEQRPVMELVRKQATGELGIGMLFGVGLFTIVIAILWLLGTYRVTGLNAWRVFIVAPVADVPSAFIQQLLLLGILFRIMEQAIGRWKALLITIMLFGLVHLIGIPHITVMDIISILLAGLLFTMTYLLTRTLWLPIGFSMAWEVTKDGIFGAGVAGTSGVALQGWVRADLSGPALLTGGASGAQASLVTIVVILAVALALLVRAKQHKPLVVTVS